MDEERASGPSKATGERTLSDGNTTVQVSTPSPNDALRAKVPTEFRNSVNEAIKQRDGGMYPPCINPSCKSYGRSHPNCLCYSPGGEAQHQEKTILGFAHGGSVHYCSSHQAHKPDCEYYADGGEVEENTEFAQNPALAVDHAIANHGLFHALTKTGNSKSQDPDRIPMDFMENSHKGKKLIETHSNNFLDHKADPIKADNTTDLESHLQEVNENPDKMLDVGGDLGDRFPAHKVQLIAKTSNAVNYLNSIKPMNSQGGPMDPVSPPSKLETSIYKRQLSLAQKPSLIYQLIKDGTVLPQDLKTISTIYPHLEQSMIQNATKTLIENKDKKLTYKQKRSLSTIMGQPLSFIQTQPAIAAIMQANSGPQGMQNQKQGMPKKASGVELKQLNMVNQLEATPLQSRMMDKKT